MTDRSSRESRTHQTVIATAILLLLAPPARSADLAVRAQAFFAKHCIDCHDADTKKAGLDLTALPWKPNDPKVFDRWVKVFDKVDKEKMPPPSKKRPDPAARARVSETACARSCTPRTSHDSRPRDAWCSAASIVSSTRIRSTTCWRSTCRCNIIFPKTPRRTDSITSPKACGFRCLHMEQYLEAADAAISAAIDLRQRPAGVQNALSLSRRRERSGRRQEEGKEDLSRVARRGRHLRRQFAHGAPPIPRTRARTLPDPDFRFRLPGGRTPGLAEAVRHRLQDQALARLLRLARERAAKSRWSPISPRASCSNLSPFDTNYDDKGREQLTDIGAEAFTGRGIAIEWVEVEGPLVDTWPPPSVGRLFGDTPHRAGQASPIRPAGPGVHDRAGRPAIGRGTAVARVRVPGVPAPGHVGRGAVLCQTGASRARRRPVVRGRDARGLPRRAHVAAVPVSRGTPRPSRRLGLGVPAVLLSLELAAGRAIAAARGQRDPARTRDPARPGRADVGLPQVAGVRRELRRPVARVAADRLHPARPEALPGIRRHPESVDGRRNAGVLRANAARRWEAEQLHSFRLSDAQSPDRGTLPDRPA